MIDPELQVLLNSLKADLILYKESIREVADDIIREGFSSYPVFIAHQHEVSVGEKILDKDELSMTWSINATTLEELIEKKVVLPGREQAFRESYKDPAAFMCILVLTANLASFVFIPYASSADPKNN